MLACCSFYPMAAVCLCELLQLILLSMRLPFILASIHFVFHTVHVHVLYTACSAILIILLLLAKNSDKNKYMVKVQAVKNRELQWMQRQKSRYTNSFAN